MRLHVPKGLRRRGLDVKSCIPFRRPRASKPSRAWGDWIRWWRQLCVGVCFGGKGWRGSILGPGTRMGAAAEVAQWEWRSRLGSRGTTGSGRKRVLRYQGGGGGVRKRLPAPDSTDNRKPWAQPEVLATGNQLAGVCCCSTLSITDATVTFLVILLVIFLVIFLRFCSALKIFSWR